MIRHVRVSHLHDELLFTFISALYNKLVYQRRPIRLKFALKVTHPFEKRRLRQISTYNISTIRDSENVQVRRIESRPRAYQRAIDGMRTLPISPPKNGSKSNFLFFLNKNFQHQLNKIAFKRTRSLSNAVCFKHDNNVCACAVSALILHLVVNLYQKMVSATSIFYLMRKSQPPDSAFCLFWGFWRFFNTRVQSRAYYYFRFKI